MPDEGVPSPCRQICKLDEENVCEGCGRTIEEITTWIEMSDDEKRAVWERLGRPIE